MTNMRKATDSLGVIEVPADKLLLVGLPATATLLGIFGRRSGKRAHAVDLL